MAEPNRITSQNDEWPYSPKFHEFADFLGLPAAKDSKGVYWRGDSKLAKKIEEIYAWGKYASGSEDIVDVMLAVRRLQRDLGINWKGLTLIDHLWGWVQLDTKGQKLTEEIGKVNKEKQLYQNPPELKEEENGR